MMKKNKKYDDVRIAITTREEDQGDREKKKVKSCGCNKFCQVVCH